MDIDVSIALFRNQSILRWCRVVWVIILHMPHIDLMTVPPSPSINYTLQQEDTTVVMKFHHILGLCSSS